MPLLNTIIFSKNRACQLDAFLRSMKTFWKDWQEESKVSVIWTYEGDEYLAGYERLFKDHPEINYISQKDKDFKQTMISAMDSSIPYTAQFVDDIVFINPLSLKCQEFEDFKNDPETTCLSLRMHPGITYCYMLNIPMTPPPEAPTGKWAWINLPGDWGYPMSQDGHIFRTEDVTPCIYNEEYAHPNALEGTMTYVIPRRQYTRCFQDAKLINVPSNRVGQNLYNRVGNISSDFLNDQYLKGLRIDIKPFYGLKVNAVHYEVEYQWVEVEKPKEPEAPSTIKYHLGCGLNYFPGYVNIDYPQSEHSIVTIKADIYADLMTVKLEPCIEIQSHHVYEHFNYMESLALLVKWTRALKVGGTLIINIPDIDVLCQELSKSIQAQDLKRIFKIVRLLYGSHEADWAYHINGWTLDTLFLVLGKIGYSAVGYRKTGTPEASFPNCGIYMVFKKEHIIPDIDKIAREFLSYYCDLPAQEDLLREFNKQFDILMEKI